MTDSKHSKQSKLYEIWKAPDPKLWEVDLTLFFMELPTWELPKEWEEEASADGKA